MSRCLLALFPFPSSLLRVGDQSMHQRSPLPPVPRQLWTFRYCSVCPILYIVCPSPRFALFTPPIDSSYRSTNFWLESHGRNTGAGDVLLSSIDPAIAYFLMHWCILLLHWSDVPSNSPSTIDDMLASQNLVLAFASCPQPSMSVSDVHILQLRTLMLTEVFVLPWHVRICLSTVSWGIPQLTLLLPVSCKFPNYNHHFLQ